MQQQLKVLASAITSCMRCDQHRLRQRLRQLHEGNTAHNLDRLAQAIAHSRQRREQRRHRLPVPAFKQPLPVIEKKAAIGAALQENQVIIVCGETGSGKTTQLPKICLEQGRGIAGMIGHTQPRRIAARSVANRIAEELNTELGKNVGYKVRFHDRVSPNTYVKVMTDGILLAETQGDRFLEQYDTLIIDEAHERSLNIDFLLGYLKQLLPKRPDLKVIITSATINTECFSRHFNHAPVIEVSGRAYPVEIRYRPLGREEETLDRDLQQAILEAVDELSRLDAGDILIFLPGEREIRETAEALRKHHPMHTEILPLYARLSAAEQNRVFTLHTGRRIVLATNVAETSLTVPGIRYVVDPGLARLSRYSIRSKVQQLPIEKISQSSAKQRAGRCGRVAAGVCIRLYSEEDFLSRPKFTEPEILRTNLASVILQMKVLKLGTVESFPFIDPPPLKMINDGLRLLEELGALDKAHNLTDTGRQLAPLPVDPRLGRMVLASREFHCVSEILIIASALSIQDPRERPLDAQHAADAAQRQFQDTRSDFLSFLKLWEAFHSHRKHLSQRKLRAYCREHFLSYLRLREWHDLYQQLHLLVTNRGFRLNQIPAEYDAIHRALLTGLLGHIARKAETATPEVKKEGNKQLQRGAPGSSSPFYVGARNIKLHIFPGSTLFKRSPLWIMAAELVATSRLYARCVARIEPEWIESLASHLVKRSHFAPHWEKYPAQVVAYEQVALYGLIITPKRRIHYGPLNPEEAREIFIREALVKGDYATQAPFFQHNRKLVLEIEALEHKSRRQDILVDEETVYRFYEARIPAGIYSGATFEQWRRQAEQENPRLLFLRHEDLMRHEAATVTAARFPDHIRVHGISLPLSYRFEPDHPEDGVTVTIPLVILNQLKASSFEWLVPGLLKEKVIYLLKALPKRLRRHFVPVPDFAEACVQALNPDQQESLLETLAHHLRKMTGVALPTDIWRDSELPLHLQMNFRLVDENGRELAANRDLAALQHEWGDQAQNSFQGNEDQSFTRRGITCWNFGTLPERIEFERHGLSIIGYPALQDEGASSVALILMDSAEAALAATYGGLRRLFMLALSQQVNYLRNHLPGIKMMCLHYMKVPPPPWGAKASITSSCEDLKQELIQGAVDRTFILDRPLPRSAEEFTARKEQGRGELLATASQFCQLVGGILAEYHGITQRLKQGKRPLAWLDSLKDIQEQLAHLIYAGFISQTPSPWLVHFPRYLKAVGIRLSKLQENPSRDQQRCREINPLWQACRRQLEAQHPRGVISPALLAYRWLLEEYRVSLFAQELGTAYPVSPKRLKHLWKEV